MGVVAAFYMTGSTVRPDCAIIYKIKATKFERLNVK